MMGAVGAARPAPGGFVATSAPGRWGPDPADLPEPLRARFSAVRLLAFDFDGVMTDNRVYVDETGRESVACSRFEGHGLDRLRPLGLAMCILSTEVNPVVARRAAKLRLEVEQALSDKVAALSRFCERHGCGLDACAFVGNDVNDIPVLSAVGLPIVVADAHPSVLSLAAYRTARPGGQGAVREICDLIADIHLVSGAPARDLSREKSP